MHAGPVTDDHSAADEERGLDAKFDRLNRDFYTAEPADYFDIRLPSLMLLPERPDGVLTLSADGVTYGHLHARVTEIVTYRSARSLRRSR